jgi:cyclophilin family peptidyl-prolyl cis-trans isomerase
MIAGRPLEHMSELTATLHTSEGPIEVRLFDDRAPRTVENFVNLAEHDPAADDDPGVETTTWEDPETGEIRGDSLYAGVEFHRVIEDFMVQVGDPLGNGKGGPGYTFDDEFHEDLRHDGPGVLSMANRGPNTNGSQFFITLAAQPHLDEKHPVFGEVIDGMDIVEKIGATSTDMHDHPTSPITIDSVEIHR